MGIGSTSYRHVGMFLRDRGRCLSTANRLAERKASFDLHASTADHERRTEMAAKNRNDAHAVDVFRMVLPPPNVTGKLHLGHALTVTVEDVLCRYKRVYGHQAIWHAGFDHAGIATQTVVEQQLWKEKKIRRHELSREEFLELCHQWKETYTGEPVPHESPGICFLQNLEKKVLIERFGEAVVAAFCRLHSEGLIFRERRLVNWCPTLQSTISDQEVDHIDVSEPKTISVPSLGHYKERIIKVGTMHHIRYELVEKQSLIRYLEVATTRPETIFADVALAVHPCDKRYSHLVGKMVRHPLVLDRTMPIIADESVIPDKGTGVLKITPSHDFTDLEIARRHGKEIDAEAMKRICIDEQARLINASGFNGLDRFEARQQVRLNIRVVNQ
ncbi:unnamed protein product [Toxocara canis]|uniref:valine--tRNA ligase n=1 Tax=Toxocara canis TaxID=6265 RepID=A0A183V652_TOXCA|nr:unnamed protein product [Toxocara canis]